MSCRMDFRKTPSDKGWLGSFKCNLRDVIDERCGSRANETDLDFFRGLYAATFDKDDKRSLGKVVELLENGHTVDFEITC